MNDTNDLSSDLSADLPADLPTNIQRSKWAILFSYYGLFLYFLVSTLLTTGSFSLATPLIWFIQVAPLLIFATGLHRNTFRTYGWMCFVVLLYFTHGVLVAFRSETLWLGLVEVALCVCLFLFLIIYIRQYRAHFQVPL